MHLTRRQTLAGTLAGMAATIPFRAFAQAATAPSAAAAPAFLTPFEHASLMLTLNGKRLLIDPVGDGALYSGGGAIDAVLITHEHPDHFDPETLDALVQDGTALIVNPAVAGKLAEPLKARATVMANGDKGEVAGIPLEAVPAYNTTPDRLKYHPQGRDNGYVLTSQADGRIYVAGDTEDTPEFRAQRDIALALVPMNLPFTMTAEQAAAGVAAMAPRQAIAYHHRGTDPAQFARLVTQAGAPTQVIMVDWYPGNDDPTGKKPE